ncbi:Pentatricopeptide repeat-containing protein [Phytophthora infestans]|uniref:Pentatricopeptide repeat-containing protein n=1 Tax=Phytophthora infestans TaxID=4787 RepID=A0A833WPN6_PHYIN|nr:Pentatricopeptide repeat-containing protein [Phytophthora infestans]
MWRACRVAALRQLRIEATRVSVARAPLALQQLGGVNSYFTNIAGVDREVLLTRSTRDLRNELGDAQIGTVVKALKGELSDAMAREDVTSDEIIDLFMVAQKTRAISVMVDAFEFLDANYPAHINFSVYGEIFRILARKNNSKRLIEIYETAKPRFRAVPEIIYRFGIVGFLQNNDMDKAVEIWQEMTEDGHETTNEITSRLMMAFARKGDTDKVQELYNSVDPQIGFWHESCIDRVILSMGIIEQPAKSFEFYSNSSMKLSGGTLIALLSVCKSNNCKQQASDILANRKKFDLFLDARGYNRIMMTLEFLDRNSEIKDILEEMVENNVRFDTRTNNIIERNAEFLKDTSFVADSNKSKTAGFTLSPRIREMLAQGNTKDAADLVDSIAKPVEQSQVPEDFEGEIPQDALLVSPSVARDAVRVYIQTNEDDKVAALVKGFSVVRGKYAYALAEVVTHYLKLRNKTGDELGYAASKAMLFQGVQVYRVDDTLRLFRRFHDPVAAVELFQQVLASYWGKDGRNAPMTVTNDVDGTEEQQSRPYYVNFNIGKVGNMVLQILVENGRVEEALDTLKMMESRGLDANQGNYVTILSSMRKHLRNSKNSENRDVKYDINDVQMVLQDLRSRNMKVIRAIVGYLCPAYVGANKQQRLELLEAFAEAQSDPNDSYILPHLCYETLLNFMAEEGDMAEVRELYEEAVASLSDKETLGVPRGWVTILVSKLAKDGNIEEAEQITKKMLEECGGYTFRAVVSVLRGAIEAQKPETIDNMIALLEDRDFVIGLPAAYELVHVAREKDLSLKALDIIRLFEKGNLKEVAPAEDGKGNLEAAFFRRQRGDVHALRKVKTMYNVALKTCEKQGLWKQALLLRDRMTTLFGQEAMDEITMSQNGSTRKHRERKEKQSADQE